MLRHGMFASESSNDGPAVSWYLPGSRRLGASPLITTPSCRMRVAPLCHMSTSRRCPTLCLDHPEILLVLCHVISKCQLAVQIEDMSILVRVLFLASYVQQICTHMTTILSLDWPV